MRISDSSIPEIDLWSAWNALKLRWWVVPLAMLISAAFLFVNESDLQTSPSFILISRTYEARDESSVLTVANIDPGSIIPFPSFDNQVLALQSPSSRQKIAESIGADTFVTVSRSEQKFSLLDTLIGDGNKRFTFLSLGTPSYTFACSAPTTDECNIAIDAYLTEISRLRAESIRQGFDRAEKLVSALAGDSQLNEPSLVFKQRALAYAKTLVTGEVVLISTTSEQIGPTVGTVKTSTYVFGLGVGALLGLLVVLQLTVSDRKIRSLRKLVATVGEENVLGLLRLDQPDSSPQYVAAGIVHQATRHGATIARLLPVDETVNFDLVTASLTDALHENSLTISFMLTVDHLTTMELLPPPHSVIVLVTHARTSRTDNLKKVWAIAEHAGNTIAGVILVQQ